MRKYFFLLAIAISLVSSMAAQAIQETIANIGSITATAYTISIDKDVKVVQEAMKSRLSSAGLKTKNTDGYLASIEQVFSDINDSPINLYTKVEEQGKKKNKSTVVTVCAYTSNLTIDQNVLKSNTQRFLQSFVSYVDRFEASKDLDAKQNELKKANKVLASSTSELESINKSIQSDQDKIAKKQKHIEDLKKEIENIQNEISSLEQNIEKNNKKISDAQAKVDAANQQVKSIESDMEVLRQRAQ